PETPRFSQAELAPSDVICATDSALNALQVDLAALDIAATDRLERRNDIEGLCERTARPTSIELSDERRGADQEIGLAGDPVTFDRNLEPHTAVGVPLCRCALAILHRNAQGKRILSRKAPVEVVLANSLPDPCDIAAGCRGSGKRRSRTPGQRELT